MSEGWLRGPAAADIDWCRSLRKLRE